MASEPTQRVMVSDPTVRRSHRPPIQARHYAVASGHYLATAAAMRLLDAGGNAIDAGVAAGICINVLLPDLTSFGGVAPTMVYEAESGEVRSISGLGYWSEEVDASVYHTEEHDQIPI